MAGNAERTYLMIKPDGVQRGLAGKIIARFEERGYKLVSAACGRPTTKPLVHVRAHERRPPWATMRCRCRRRCRRRRRRSPDKMLRSATQEADEAADADGAHAYAVTRAGRDEALRSVQRAHGEALRRPRGQEVLPGPH